MCKFISAPVGAQVEEAVYPSLVDEGVTPEEEISVSEKGAGSADDKEIV